MPAQDHDDHPGLSIEEIEDRLADHPCREHPVAEVPCPCHERDPLAGCIALVCTGCRAPILVMVSPRPLCAHALSLLPRRVRPLRRHGGRRHRRRPR